MRRLLISVSLAYLLVAFGFILLTMLNAADEGNLVWLAEADAGLIVALSTVGILMTLLLGLRILLDSMRRQDLERRINEPRRKSQDMTQRK
jgi:hypothetical protein